jgi:hypothetical protein
MMCAAHGDDLEAASRNGLRTAFIARPEERPGMSDQTPSVPVDFTGSLDELSARLGA